MIHLSAAAKVDYVVTELLPMLQNDLRVVVESGCPQHGCGGSGPNFTVALLCMVACETVGALAAPRHVRGHRAVRAFIGRVGSLVGDSRYERFAGLIFALFRNGIGHSFLPKQCQTLASRTIWFAPCIDYLRDDPEGVLDVHNLRLATHLVIRGAGAARTFHVVTKILYLDVSAAIDEFAARLKEGHAQTLDAFVSAFDDWMRANSRIRDLNKLTAVERSALEAS